MIPSRRASRRGTFRRFSLSQKPRRAQDKTSLGPASDIGTHRALCSFGDSVGVGDSEVAGEV